MAFEEHIDILPYDKKHKILRTDVLAMTVGNCNTLAESIPLVPRLSVRQMAIRLLFSRKGNDNKFWWTGSFTGGNGWKWTTFLPHGVFKSDPAAVISADALPCWCLVLATMIKSGMPQSLDGGKHLAGVMDIHRAIGIYI